MINLDKIKEKFEDIKEDISYRLEGASKSVFIALGCLGLILILLIALMINQCVQPQKVVVQKSFETKDEYIFPETVNMTNDYYYSRDAKDTWNQDDVNEWFNTPGEKDIKELSEANDNIIKEIMGAAP